MLKSKPFIIGVEGYTTDGREIQAEWLEQAAKNYNPKKYAARLNCEHLRGISPDGPFGAYGDVLELKTKTIDIDGTKKIALLASVCPTPELIALNKKKQKVFTSMELDIDFTDTKEAYLIGLAVTDSPASLGTEMLSFAAKAEVNPLLERKQKPSNLFSVGTEADFEFEEETEDESLTDKITALFSINKKAKSHSSDQSQAIISIAEEVTKLSAQVAELSRSENSGADNSADSELEKTVNGFSAELKELKKSLEKIPNFSHRPAASGGESGKEEETDC